MRKLIFEKYAGNPVLTASQFPSDIMYVMNPGAIKFNGEYLLLVDAATTSTPIVFWIARSRDGIHFTPDPEPIDWPAHRYHDGVPVGNDMLAVIRDYEKNVQLKRV